MTVAQDIIERNDGKRRVKGGGGNKESSSVYCLWIFHFLLFQFQTLEQNQQRMKAERKRQTDRKR